jgi:hypothetical protein
MSIPYSPQVRPRPQQRAVPALGSASRAAFWSGACHAICAIALAGIASGCGGGGGGGSGNGSGGKPPVLPPTVSSSRFAALSASSPIDGVSTISFAVHGAAADIGLVIGTVAGPGEGRIDGTGTVRVGAHGSGSATARFSHVGTYQVTANLRTADGSVEAASVRVEVTGPGSSLSGSISSDLVSPLRLEWTPKAGDPPVSVRSQLVADGTGTFAFADLSMAPERYRVVVEPGVQP